MNDTEIKLPQPDEISNREKEDAMGAYFMMFAAWAIGFPLPILNLVAAVIYFFVNKKNSRFIAFHALQSLLSQIPVTLVNVGFIAWLAGILLSENTFSSAFFVYLVFMGLSNIVYIIYSIIALGRARKGRFFYFPFFGRLSFARYYGPDAVSFSEPVEENKAPEGF
ncbi:MAG: DUF4870 domain-containing protein [Spirochaetes bacterium]|nr:DUF4870 domain-containing protein [Spirochaetota bacterium]